jgi:hypothetical protein
VTHLPSARLLSLRFAPREQTSIFWTVVSQFLLDSVTFRQPIMQSVQQSVRDAAQQYPKPAGFTPSYGTAGFRATAELLTSTLFRCEPLQRCVWQVLERVAVMRMQVPVQMRHVRARYDHFRRALVRLMAGVAC